MPNPATIRQAGLYDGAHLKIVSERSFTILLRASLALKSRGRHLPAAPGCRSPRSGRYGTGAVHGWQATGITAGFSRRVPAIGYRVLTVVDVVL